ncbi:hypothetical protein DSECCO2_449930 [anaerobic digester metagenome]
MSREAHVHKSRIVVGHGHSHDTVFCYHQGRLRPGVVQHCLPHRLFPGGAREPGLAEDPGALGD